MKTEIAYNQELDIILKQLNKGAFLTVRDGDKVNTMTVGWASFGVIWNKPVLMVAVRKSRYTYTLISNAKDFTVSFPVNIDMRKELIYCGTYSGKDIDKIKACKLSLKKGNKVESPIIGECDYHYECKILFSQFMESNALDDTIKIKFYSNDDYHVLYFGEIVDSYKTPTNL